MRIYKYDVGEVFPEHIDYKVKRQIIKDGKDYLKHLAKIMLINL